MRANIYIVKSLSRLLHRGMLNLKSRGCSHINCLQYFFLITVNRLPFVFQLSLNFETGISIYLYPINRLNPAILMCLLQAMPWISIIYVIVPLFVFNERVKVRGSFKLSFHIHVYYSSLNCRSIHSHSNFKTNCSYIYL